VKTRIVRKQLVEYDIYIDGILTDTAGSLEKANRREEELAKKQRRARLDPQGKLALT